MPNKNPPWMDLLDALGASNKAVLDAVRGANERGYRFSKRLLNEAEQAQRELSQLRQRFAREPKDMRSVYQSSVDLARRSAGHSAALAREFVDAAGQAGQETRQTAGALIQANRQAAQAMTAALRAAASDLGRRATGRPAPKPGAAGSAPRATARRGPAKRRAPARKPAGAARRRATPRTPPAPPSE